MVVRACIPLIILALSGNVFAASLGDLRGHSRLGESLRLEIDLFGVDKGGLDPTCFRLVQPTGGDLPFLKNARLTVRRANPPVLEIYSASPLREPILQLAVQVACGPEVSREYLFLASPVSDVAPNDLADVKPPLAAPSRPRTLKPEHRVSAENPPTRPAPRQAKQVDRRERSISVKESPRRLILAKGSDVGEPSLCLVGELLSSPVAEPTEAQREILRLEFRMLIALHDQATTQLAAAEKLRTMESTLGDLQQRTTAFVQRLEQEGGATLPPVPAVGQAAGGAIKPQESAALPPASSAPVALSLPAVSPQVEAESILSEWALYGVFFGALLSLGGWFRWRSCRARQQNLADVNDQFAELECRIDPWPVDESAAGSAIDLPVEPVAQNATMSVDLDLGRTDDGSLPPSQSSIKAPNSIFSVSDTTVDECFEANPVMELADIMLSFGRVKGAAQALQEYIDNNPQEALQPWIRLIEVYRMAGMRQEFEAMALNLNQNFNVEVQHWDASERKTGGGALDLVLDDAPHAPLPQCLEDMPRLMAMIVELWPSSDVVGYLYQLLRDNRGGQRAGFSLPVVEEILFLVELKDTANRFQKDGSDA